MFSPWAALRTLVLPFGTITGTRIILDGVNGRISFYNAANVEVIREDSATSTITAGSQGTGARVVIDGSSAKITGYDASNNPGATFDAANQTVTVEASSGAKIELIADELVGALHESITKWWPPDLTGTTWIPGQIRAAYTGAAGSEKATWSIASPRETGASNSSLISMTGGRVGDDTDQVAIYGENSWFYGDTLDIYDRSAGATAAVSVNGTLGITGLTTLSNSLPAMSGSTAGETEQIKFGSSVPTTNGTGQWTINTGLSTLRGFVAWNGDVNARPNMVIGNNRGNWPAGAGPNVSGTCYTGNTGATINNSAVRIDWMAFGL